MIKFSDLKPGNYVYAHTDGKQWMGEVTNFNHDEKEIAVSNGIQEFYFKGEDLDPIPLDDATLLKINFQKQVNGDGSVKYMKGAFRIQVSRANDFADFEIWYRDEKRHIFNPIYLHQLQNHYHSMTKVLLNDQPI